MMDRPCWLAADAAKSVVSFPLDDLANGGPPVTAQGFLAACPIGTFWPEPFKHSVPISGIGFGNLSLFFVCDLMRWAMLWMRSNIVIVASLIAENTFLVGWTTPIFFSAVRAFDGFPAIFDTSAFPHESAPRLHAAMHRAEHSAISCRQDLKGLAAFFTSLCDSFFFCNHNHSPVCNTDIIL